MRIGWPENLLSGIVLFAWSQKATNEKLYTEVLQPERGLLQQAIQRTLQLFGHVHKMNDNREVNLFAFGMDKNNKLGLHRKFGRLVHS